MDHIEVGEAKGVADPVTEVEAEQRELDRGKSAPPPPGFDEDYYARQVDGPFSPLGGPPSSGPPPPLDGPPPPPPRAVDTRVIRKLVLFSDGTGNSSAKAEKTNVWRMFQAMDLTMSDQLAMYDDGVGTSTNRYLAAIGGAFGWGLKRNVIDLYKFVCRNYVDKNTQIYGFGFSRGAFTIRVLMGLITLEGLVNFTSEAELHARANQAYAHFRRSCFKPLLLSPVWVYRLVRYLGAALLRLVTGKPRYSRAANRAVPHIKFLGLWDTVSAYGMPIAELKPAINWLFWPMDFHDLKLSAKVERACHALSLDDERTTFHPIIWDEAEESDQRRVTQVWFAGAHANVGGGYPEDQLSLVSLDWMMRQAQENGLRLQKLCVERVSNEKSSFGRIYNSRAGTGVFYRYSPREIKVPAESSESDVLPIVHSSVIARMARGADGYVPNSLPSHFLVLAPNGQLLPMTGFSDPNAPARNFDRYIAEAAPGTPQILATDMAEDRTQALEKAINELNSPDRGTFEVIEDTVWWRRAVYLACSVLAIAIVFYPWLGTTTDLTLHYLEKHTGGPIPAALQKFDDWDGYLQGIATTAVDNVKVLIPGWFDTWAATIKEHPLEVATLLSLFVWTVWIGDVLRRRIHDYRLIAWHAPLRKKFRENLLARKILSVRRMTSLLLLFDLLIVIAALVPASANAVFPFLAGAALLNMVLLVRIMQQRAMVARLAVDDDAPLFDQNKQSATYHVRKNRVLKVINVAIGNYVVPALFAIALAYLMAAVVNRVAFDLESANGQFCASANPETPTVSREVGATTTFRTNSFCWSTGRILEAKTRYRIVVSDSAHDWFDKKAHTDPRGFPANTFLYAAATPLKRWWNAPWFMPIARVGQKGNHEYALQPCLYRADGNPRNTEFDLSPNPTGIPDAEAKGIVDAYDKNGEKVDKTRHVLVAEFTPQTGGELFMFVNDAVLALPGRKDHFYKNNRGTASVTIEQVHEDVNSKFHYYCPK